MELKISLPHHYTPRTYQREIFQKFAEGFRRFILVWHRRSGKDKTMLNFMICRMMERRGMYWYILPTYEQARLIIWEGMGSGIKEGMPFLEHFPEELIEYRNEQRLEIGLVNGSIFRLIGSDNVDRLVGANPVGVVYSEFSLQSVAAWKFVAPMLVENKGWAAFIFTPRGQNHAHELYQAALKNQSWFVSMKTVEETQRNADGEDSCPVVSQEEIQEERRRGEDENFIQQEYYCSFTGFMEGSYFGQLMAEAYRDNRIREVPWNPRRQVFTVWDLGIGDQTAIWFCQVEGREIFLIDYYQKDSLGLVHYIAIVKNKPYVYSTHWAPHDINQRTDTGEGGAMTRLQLARQLGMNFRVIAKIGLMDGIEQARSIIPRCYFDRVKTDFGIRSLINYHRDFNNKTLDYRPHPVHDKWSHGADAFRGVAMVCEREAQSELYEKPIQYERDFEIFGTTNQPNVFTSEPKYEIVDESGNSGYGKVGWKH